MGILPIFYITKRKGHATNEIAELPSQLGQPAGPSSRRGLSTEEQNSHQDRGTESCTEVSCMPDNLVIKQNTEKSFISSHFRGKIITFGEITHVRV